MGFCPSRRELIGFVQIIVAILSLWNYFEIDLFDTPMYDIKLFEHQCVSVTLCFVSLYYALGTWFWASKLPLTRMMARIHVGIIKRACAILGKHWLCIKPMDQLSKGLFLGIS
ncbi:uncharacterized protein isoform X2 [Musca autumnalis]|uniref:uncharacterized protein isoform X2 n=1 Tax=Musca autumnalis TaxID=221902 RepID=UPI003CF1B4B7